MICKKKTIFVWRKIEKNCNALMKRTEKFDIGDSPGIEVHNCFAEYEVRLVLGDVAFNERWVCRVDL